MTEQRQRTGWGPRLIAPELGMAAATVSRCLQRRGMSRRPPAPRDAVRRLSGPAPAICCRWTPSAWPIFAPRTCPHRRALPHQRGAQGRVGWEFCHSIVDDHSRLAYTELCPDEKAPTVTAFIERALAFLPTHHITPRRLQTDNAWCYAHNRSLHKLLNQHGIQHRRIPPRTPKSRRAPTRPNATVALPSGAGRAGNFAGMRSRAMSASGWSVTRPSEYPGTGAGPPALRPALPPASRLGGTDTWSVRGPCRSRRGPREGRGCRRSRRARRRSRAW